MGRPAHAGTPRVPTTRDVVAGVGVHIVLKKDQPTGRTVTGVVRGHEIMDVRKMPKMSAPLTR